VTAGLSATNVANGWLNTLRAGSNFTAIATPFIKLHTGDPGSAGASNAFAAASAGSISQNGTAPQWTNGGTSETITHISCWDASTSGNFLWSAALTASQAWVSGNTFTLTSSSIALTPIAA
jgi:hypothetical protein